MFLICEFKFEGIYLSYSRNVNLVGFREFMICFCEVGIERIFIIDKILT